MHVEIEVALNFIISYLYNKLPRRRVNIFGEELEKALKHKFQGHWYPDKPVKGSAFRCFKTGDTPDPVLEIAAVQSGVTSADILENLPHELSVWIDPGEVSYRIGEKGVIKILYSASNAPVPVHETEYCNVVAAAIEHEVSRTFNPEAQCFQPMESSLSAKFGNLSMGPNAGMVDKFKGHVPAMGSGSDSGEDRNSNSDHSEDNSSDNSRNMNGSDGYIVDGGNQGSASTFLHRQQPPSTFTIASFAATKFGSTKLKTSSKRNNRQFSSRMSPVEFQNYIKQRSSMHQPPFMQSPNSAAAMMGHNLKPLMSPSRSLSPANHAAGLSINSDPFYYHNNHGGYYPPQQQQQQQQQQQPAYLGSHLHQPHHHQQQMGGYAAGLGGGSPLVTPSASANNAISSSISSISSASSSSASSSVSSSSLGDQLLQFGGGPFGAAAVSAGNSNRMSAQMYNYYASSQDAAFMDSSFFAPLSAVGGNQLEDSVPATSLLEGNSTKFGVIGGGLSGAVGQTEPSLECSARSVILSNSDGNNNSGVGGNESSSGNAGSPPQSSNNSMDNLQSNNFYSGSSGSPFPQLLVAN